METTRSSVLLGDWIKQRRKALDLTQERLAQAVGCSVILIRKIESAERRPSRQIARLMAQALRVPAEEQEQFIQIARQERGFNHLPSIFTSLQPPLAERKAPVYPPLPVPGTQFIGRDHELAAILQLMTLSECRMLTLVGPGGIGKSRLALEAVRSLSADYPEQFPDGIVYVPLTQLNCSSHLIPAIADHLQFRLNGNRWQQQQLLSYLEKKTLLLLLDNLEQLLPVQAASDQVTQGIDFLSQVLTTAPTVKLLVTSRERLNLHGEWLFELSGLPVPEMDHSILSAMENPTQYSSIALFLQHTRRVVPNFDLASDDLQEVVRICHLVEGFPLGIELAASWMRVLPVREIANEITQSLDFLEAATRDLPARHRSLRAVFEHSWELLTGDEQELLSKLSVFQGGFDRQAAEQVCGASMTSLLALVDKSLVYRSSAQRYELHELIHKYAAEKLAECQDQQRHIRNSHSCYYLALLQAGEAGLKNRTLKEAGEQLAQEMNNVQAARDWALETGILVDIQPV